MFDPREVFKLRNMNGYSCSNALKSLKYLSVFLGIPSQFDEMRRRAGLKRSSRSASNVALRILALDAVKEAFSYLELISRSGLDERYKQAIYFAAETEVKSKKSS